MTKLIGGCIDIITSVATHDTLQKVDFLCALVLHTQSDGTLILGIVALDCTQLGSLLIALHRIGKTTGCIVCIATTVERIGTVAVAGGIDSEELIECRTSSLNLLFIEVAVAHIILRQSILLACLWGTSQETAVTLQSHTTITL